MPNFIANILASRNAEERARMTHSADTGYYDYSKISPSDLGQFVAEVFTPYGNYTSGRDAVPSRLQ